MIEDKLLIWKLKAGNKDALRQIYEKYKNSLLKLAVFLVNDAPTAEDIVQDVFLGFAQKAATCVIWNLKGYLTTAVVNNVRNRFRDEKRHNTILQEDFDSITTETDRPEHWAILNEQFKLLSRAMRQLPYEQREVITLYKQANLTFREIAKLQQTAVSTVQGRYRYGIDKLRTLLNSEVEK
jgi:RNA polymerase sigma-70 factor (ECF subfamily)